MLINLYLFIFVDEKRQGCSAQIKSESKFFVGPGMNGLLEQELHEGLDYSLN